MTTPPTTRRRALLVGVPDRGLNVSLAMQRLVPALQRMGFDSIDQCVGSRATREGILSALDTLTEHARPGDATLVYYFGHGGRVRFSDLPEPWSTHVFGYITCHRATRGGGWQAVLDQELSTRLRVLDQRCGNVTALFDCCFSAELVRDTASPPPNYREEPAPPWARTVTEHAAALCVESSPTIVRMCGASAKREAYAATRGGRQIGRMTEALLTLLDDAGDDWPDIPWAFAAHRVREHVIDALGMESQWVNIAGPSTRRLFSTNVTKPAGSVSFVPSDDPERGWIRAGWLQGVAVGDRWDVLAATTAPDGSELVATTVTVESVGRNRADVVLAHKAASPLVPGMPAVMRRVAVPLPVAAPTSLHSVLSDSAWLRVDDDAKARTTEGDDDLLIEHPPFAPVRIPRHDSAQVIEVLEAQARTQALRGSLEAQTPGRCPLRYAWYRNTEASALPATGATLDSRDRIRIELEFEGTAPLPWFVVALWIDPAGQLYRLNARMPEGIELGPGHREVLGVRPGQPRIGLPLPWPRGVAPGSARSQLLLLASRRPLSLDHLMPSTLPEQEPDLSIDRITPATVRSHRPEHARACAWQWFDFTLTHHE